MSLETTVMERLKTAMKSKDEVALRTLRAIKAAILVEKTASGAKQELTPEDETKILVKMAKQRRDSIQIFETQNRKDLSENENEELQIIESFLPQQLSPDQLTEAIKKIISDTGASGIKDMGKVIGTAQKSLVGQSEGADIAQEVKRQLSEL